MGRPKLCKCGCGKKTKHGSDFLPGHHRRGVKLQPVIKESISQGRRKQIHQDELESKVHRLEFPTKNTEEIEGEYRFRKFEYFCEHYTTHVHGRFAGKPVVLMKWQKDIMHRLFSALDANNKRLIRKLFIHIARKNGKTFLLALLILYYLAELSFDDPACEIVSCAGTREQSTKTVFRTCKLIVGYSKELSQLLKIGTVPAFIMNRLNNGVYEPLSAEGKTNLGRNLSLICFDETLNQPNEDLWSAMETSQGLREEPLFVSASTAGESRATFYYTIYELIKAIQVNPDSAPDTLVACFEVPEDMDWQTPEAFMLANPAAGEGGFRDPEEIKEMLKKAVKEEGKTGFLQFYLNKWSQHGARTLIPLEKFDACCVDEIDIESFGNCRVVAGLDWSQTTDLTSLGLIIEVEKNKPDWIFYSFSWLAGESLAECSRRDKLPYEKWETAEIIFFEGKSVIQIEAVKALLGGIKSHFPRLKKIGFDPYQKDAMAPLEDYFEMVPVPQQYAFISPPLKLIKSKLLEGKIKMERNPLLRAAFENARILTDVNGNIRPDKSRSMSRIDPLVALTIATNIAIREWGTKT